MDYCALIVFNNLISYTYIYVDVYTVLSFWKF